MNKIAIALCTVVLLISNAHAHNRIVSSKPQTCHITVNSYWPEDIIVNVKFDDGVVASSILNASQEPYKSTRYILTNYNDNCKHSVLIHASRTTGASVHIGEYHTGDTAQIIMHN